MRTNRKTRPEGEEWESPQASFGVLRHCTLPKHAHLITNHEGSELQGPELLLEFH